MADKHSVIQIFDSYLETPAKGKRVDAISVEHHASHSALERDLLPNQSQLNARLADPLRDIPAELLQQVTTTQRGSQIDGWEQTEVDGESVAASFCPFRV